MLQVNLLELVSVISSLVHQHVVGRVVHLGGPAQNPQVLLARATNQRVGFVIGIEDKVVGVLRDGAAEGDSESSRVGGRVGLSSLSVSFRRGTSGGANVSCVVHEDETARGVEGVVSSNAVQVPLEGRARELGGSNLIPLTHVLGDIKVGDGFLLGAERRKGHRKEGKEDDRRNGRLHGFCFFASEEKEMKVWHQEMALPSESESPSRRVFLPDKKKNNKIEKVCIFHTRKKNLTFPNANKSPKKKDGEMELPLRSCKNYRSLLWKVLGSWFF